MEFSNRMVQLVMKLALCTVFISVVAHVSAFAFSVLEIKSGRSGSLECIKRIECRNRLLDRRTKDPVNVSQSAVLSTRLHASMSYDDSMPSSSSKKSNSKSSQEKEEISGVDWDWKELVESVFTPDDSRPIILFDGVCNLCNGGINFAMDQDQAATFRFCSLQSKVAQSLLINAGQSPTDNSKIVLVVSPDETYFSSDAVARICQDLDAPALRWFGNLGRFTPNWIRESIYQFVSKNRYRFGENDSCRLDFDGTLTSRFISDPNDNFED